MPSMGARKSDGLSVLNLKGLWGYEHKTNIIRYSQTTKMSEVRRTVGVVCKYKIQIDKGPVVRNGTHFGGHVDSVFFGDRYSASESTDC